MSEERTVKQVAGCNAEPSQGKWPTLRQKVAKLAMLLQVGYRDDLPSAVSTLAKLRRGVGREPGEIVELLTWTSPGIWVDDPQGDRVSDSERASHLALTLFAMHQQGHRDQLMHREGTNFGEAVGKLRTQVGQDRDAGVLRRFNAMSAATEFSGLARHARGLIQLLSANDIGLDYGLFAEDLCKLMDPYVAKDVRNRWGRSFYRMRTSRPSGAVEPNGE